MLAEVEAGRLALDRKVEVTTRDVTPEQIARNGRWGRLPVTHTVQQLLDLSIVESDNPSTDRLLDLIGGPAAVTRRLAALDLAGIEVKFKCREQSRAEGRLNRGTAAAMNRLLVGLHTGALLKPPQQALLLDMMTRSQTGLRRLRGNLPPGTVVADKTGTGPDVDQRRRLHLAAGRPAPGHLRDDLRLTPVARRAKRPHRHHGAPRLRQLHPRQVTAQPSPEPGRRTHSANPP